MSEPLAMGADRKRAGRYQATASGNITTLRGYIDGGGATSGTQVVRPVVYADSAGAPAALLRAGSAVTITAGRTPGWVDLPLDSAVAVTADTYYWLGFFSGATSNIARIWVDTGTRANSADTYTDGPSDPFGTYTTDTNGLPHIEAVGTATVAGGDEAYAETVPVGTWYYRAIVEDVSGNKAGLNSTPASVTLAGEPPAGFAVPHFVGSFHGAAGQPVDPALWRVVSTGLTTTSYVLATGDGRADVGVQAPTQGTFGRTALEYRTAANLDFAPGDTSRVIILEYSPPTGPCVVGLVVASLTGANNPTVDSPDYAGVLWEGTLTAPQWSLKLKENGTVYATRASYAPAGLTQAGNHRLIFRIDNAELEGAISERSAPVELMQQTDASHALATAMDLQNARVYAFIGTNSAAMVTTQLVRVEMLRARGEAPTGPSARRIKADGTTWTPAESETLFDAIEYTATPVPDDQSHPRRFAVARAGVVQGVGASFPIFGPPLAPSSDVNYSITSQSESPWGVDSAPATGTLSAAAGTRAPVYTDGSDVAIVPGLIVGSGVVYTDGSDVEVIPAAQSTGGGGVIPSQR